MKPDPIKAKIQELCPDVMELRLGTELELVSVTKLHAQLRKKFGTSKYIYDGQSKLLCEHGWLDFSDMYLFHRSEWQINGSPITLAVVLRAIKKTGKVGRIDTNNFYSDDAEWVMKLVIYWNLEKDSWDSQTKETQLFVGSLLGV
jgi:hypothetical protein